MELKYRGISYNTSAPSVEGTETTEPGVFRGARFTLKRYQVRATTQPIEQLRFLGRTYTH